MAGQGFTPPASHFANNVTNLLLDPLVTQAAKEQNIDTFSLLEQEPDAGLGNGGLGRLDRMFLDSMATMQLPASEGYGLRYEYGIFKQPMKDGWQHEQPDNWLRQPDPWEVARPHERVEIRLNAVHAGMSGRTNMVVGFWNHQFAHVPIVLAASQCKKIDPEGILWNSVLASTGQPWDMR
jgi:glucan phosphorylase